VHGVAAIAATLSAGKAGRPPRTPTAWLNGSDLQRFERLDELAEADVVTEVELEPAGRHAHGETGKPLGSRASAVGQLRVV
jgi:hypothetical protein